MTIQDLRLQPAARRTEPQPAWLVSTLGVALLVAGLVLHAFPRDDAALFLALQALTAHVPDRLWAFLSLCGLGWTAVLLAAGASRREAWPLAAMLWALVLGGAMLHGLKLLYASPRPAAVLSAAQLHVIGARLELGSMPSGHAAAAATVALLLAWGRTALPRHVLPAVLFAGLVDLSRVAVGAHWPSDVLAGAGLGVLAALLAVRLEAWRPMHHALQRPRGQLLVALLQIAAAPGLVLQGHDPLAVPLAWALGAVSALDGLRRAGLWWRVRRWAAQAEGAKPGQVPGNTWGQEKKKEAAAQAERPGTTGPASERAPVVSAQAAVEGPRERHKEREAWGARWTGRADAARRAAVPQPVTGDPLPRGAWVAWGAALALLFLARLGVAPLFDVDEGAFAQATREMLSSYDWWHTTLNGADRFDKPILVYWLQAASVALLGPTEAAVRLPSALCAIGWCGATAAFARPRWGDAAALAGSGLLAGSVGVLLIGRASTADALLNLLLVLSMFDLWRHLESGAKAPLRRTALWIALAVLTKGPIGLLVPGATLGLWALARRRLGVLRAVLGDGMAWLILLGVALPWYAYALHRHGRAFVDGFVMRHNVERFTGTLEGHGGSLLYYVLVLPLLALPWTPLLAALLPRLRALGREALSAWLLLWGGFVIVFFSLSGTKLPHYVLYGLTPLALLAGRRLTEPGLARGWQGALAAAWGVAFLAIVLAPWGLPRLVPRAPEGLWRTLLSTLPPWPAWPAAATLVGALLLAALLRRQAWWLRFLGAACCLGLLVVAAAVPWWGEALQAPVCRLAAVARAQPAVPAVVQWGVNQPSFAWCFGAPTPRRDPRPGEWVLLREDRPPPGAYAVCARDRGFALWRRLDDGATGAGADCR